MLIYEYNIKNMKNSDAEKWFHAMSSERQAETMRLVSQSKRKAKIAADRICRNAISDFCGINPGEIIFSKNTYGKPFAENLPVHFSISHSGDMIVCAVSDKEIGIDIEKVRPCNLRTAEKFATSSELEYISAAENGFFEIWTLKEAYFKCIGTGLGADIKKVSFNITPSGIICSENGFELSFQNTESGYICSVCCKASK